MCGCVAVWLFVGVAVWLYVCLVLWLCGDVAARLRKGVFMVVCAVWMCGCVAVWRRIPTYSRWPVFTRLDACVSVVCVQAASLEMDCMFGGVASGSQYGTLPDAPRLMHHSFRFTTLDAPLFQMHHA